MARRRVKKTVESRLTAVERGIKSLQAGNAAIRKDMRDGFARVDDRFARVEDRFAHVEDRFVHVETRFTQLETRMESGFAQIESRLEQIYNHIDGFMKLHETCSRAEFIL